MRKTLSWPFYRWGLCLSTEMEIKLTKAIQLMSSKARVQTQAFWPPSPCFNHWMLLPLESPRRWRGKTQVWSPRHTTGLPAHLLSASVHLLPAPSLTTTSGSSLMGLEMRRMCFCAILRFARTTFPLWECDKNKYLC